MKSKTFGLLFGLLIIVVQAYNQNINRIRIKCPEYKVELNENVSFWTYKDRDFCGFLNPVDSFCYSNVVADSGKVKKKYLSNGDWFPGCSSTDERKFPIATNATPFEFTASIVSYRKIFWWRSSLVLDIKNMGKIRVAELDESIVPLMDSLKNIRNKPFLFSLYR